MRTTSDYLDAFKQARGLSSDYAAGKVLGLTKQTISKYRNNKGGFDLDVAWTIAEAIGCNPSEVIAAAEITHAKHSHDAAKMQLWTHRLEHLTGLAALAAVSLALTPALLGHYLRCILC